MTIKFHRTISIERLDKFTSDTYFNDVNLYACLHKYQPALSAVTLQAFQVPDLKRITFAEATAASTKYAPAKVGDKFGPTWATWWFMVECMVPKEWHNEHVAFVWDADNEGMVWSMSGEPLQAFTGGNGWDRRAEYIISDSAQASQTVKFYIEMACNTMFGAGLNGQINAPQIDRYFTLKTAELVCVDKLACDIWYDFQIIAGMAKEMSADTQRGCEALSVANDIINAFHTDDKSTWSVAKAIGTKFLNKEGGSTRESVYAIGHAHIDTAWLWPYEETKRKCARSWATQIDLMDRFPDYKFACSQAQQFEWVMELYPGLFERIKEKAASGQFIPIGGTWVEMDCNVPSGEAFVRQFLYGQRFMKKHFGSKSTTFWLPDTFGYAGQLPQICANADIKYFLTQKLSWNNINKFPHTTFYWSGLDGTRILTHFPPGDTYCGQANVKEALYAIKNHKDKEHSNESLMVFGNGDGGGGPVPAMLERITRMKDVDGLPKVEFGDPNAFFERVEKNSPNLLEWRGELYFELHRGTYTSQALTKKHNRKTELLLRDVEFVSTLAKLKGLAYPQSELDRLWKLVLLNQFHDVLPGSSIEDVYKDSTRFYMDVMRSGEKLRDAALETLFKSSGTKSIDANVSISVAAVNTTSFHRRELVELDGFATKETYQETKSGKTLVVLDCHSMSITMENVVSPSHKVSVCQEGDTFVIKNEYVKVTFNKHGQIVSYLDLRTPGSSREIIPNGAVANKFVIYEDIPLFWDAWDVEVYHKDKCVDAGVGVAHISESGPLRASLLVTHPISTTSSLTQTISLSAISSRLDFETEVDWNENRRFLKVEFPLDIHSDVATYETAYGWVQRPTHYNTSWDLAKFEVCGHKFADLSEYGFGVALLNDCKYGYSTHGNVMKLSLLRAPKSPDAHCDIGHHSFKYALFPHLGTFTDSNAVVQEGIKFNVSILTQLVPTVSQEKMSTSFFSLENAPTVIIDCVKKAEDSDDIIVRVYESQGGRNLARLHCALSVKSCSIVNTLEEHISNVAVSNATSTGSSFSFTIKSFQVLTFKLVLE